MKKRKKKVKKVKRRLPKEFWEISKKNRVFEEKKKRKPKYKEDFKTYEDC